MLEVLERLLGRRPVALPYASEHLPSLERLPPRLPLESVAPPEPASTGKRSGKCNGKRRGGGKRPTNALETREAKVTWALFLARRPLSITELASAMNVCRGEASKRVARCGDRVRREKVGKFVMVSLPPKA